MPFLPSSIIGMWFRGLLALAILVGSATLLMRWARNLPAPVDRVATAEVDGQEVVHSVPRHDAAWSERLAAWRPGWDESTALLAGGLALALLGLGGRWIANPRLFLRRGEDEPHALPNGETRRLVRPDGTCLHVELYGAPEAPCLVFTHGWGQDADSWYYVKRQLVNRYRLIFWDLPGHGRSTQPPKGDYSLERLAYDLRTVVEEAGTGRPVTLIGHSLGGMVTLTFSRLFPQLLGPRVKSLVLVHTTYTNPLHTTSLAALYTALQKPVIEPLLHLNIWLWPAAWGLNWLSYLNGSAHRSSARQCFGGGETRGQLDFVSRYSVQTSPVVLGRGGLAMLQYDASAVLARLPIPALVIAGDLDPVTLPDASRHMVAEIPDARLQTLASTRHLGFFEQHAPFDELLTAFMTSEPPAVVGTTPLPLSAAPPRLCEDFRS